MTYNPAQPRNPIGQWTEWGQHVGWHEYKDRRGDIHHYYRNNVAQMPSGHEMMHMSAALYDPKREDPKTYKRIHITGTEDGEQLSVASTGTTCFGVVNHDREAPEHAMSVCRGNKFLPVSDNLPANETSYGGRAMQMSGRKDNKVYNSLNAQVNEKVNRAAFEGENAKVCHIDPKDFAEGMVKVRHYYENELHMSNSAARKADVYVCIDKDGKPCVKPALKLGKDGQRIVRVHSPKNTGGSPTAKVKGDDLTRMTRAMQAEGLTDVQCAISAGTGKQRNGHPQNALHFRKEFYRNKNSGDRVTSWGTIEKDNKGTEIEKARSAFNSDEEYLEYKSKVTARRNNAASQYFHPTSSAGAAKLLRRKTGNMNIPQNNIEMRLEDKEVSFAVRGDHTNTLYNGYGSRIGYEANDADGFRSMYNYTHQDKPVAAENIRTGTGKREGQYGIAVKNPSNGKTVVGWFNKRGRHLKNEIED